MAIFPFSTDVTNSELARFAPKRQGDIDPYFAGGKQRQLDPYSEQYSSLAKFGLGSALAAGGLYGAERFGYHPLDYIHSATRAAEDFSPGQVLRTFGAGDFLSQFSSTNKAQRFISPEQIQKLRYTSWFDDLIHRVGPDKGFESVIHGLTFRDGQLFAGDTLLLDNARVMTSAGTPNLAAAYSRASGFEGLPGVTDSKNLQIPIEFSNAAGKIQDEAFYFTGGPTKSRAVFNQGHAFLTEWVQRANRLAESPFEMEPFATGTGKLRAFTQKLTGIDPTLAVKSGAALPTFARMAGKWGLLGTAGYLGYQTADWAVGQSELFDSTPFSEGITAGVASVGIRGNLLASQIADVVPGLRSFQEWQEETAPGSTSLIKLASLPLAGGLAGLTGSYVTTLGDRAKITYDLMKADPTMSLGRALAEADPIVSLRAKEFGSETFDWLTRGKFKNSHVPFLGSFGRAKQFGFMGMVVGGALALPFLPGALIPESTEEELRDLYSGNKEVAVRKGRFWEFGRTPYEGTRIEYFRPHWYPRMLQASYDKSMGTDKTSASQQWLDVNSGSEIPTKDISIAKRSPFKQWILENFTYDIEKEHYADRPYPITGTAFEDIPIIGPVLGATIGQLIKPAKLMHTQEWLGSDSLDSNSPVLRLQERAGSGIRPDRGDAPPGTPIASTDLKQVIGEQSYRLTELIGLAGFTMSSIKEAITGTDEWFDQEERLQSARRMYGAERQYWDMSLGGGIGSTEFFRRLYPHRRRQIPEYNPIRNMMPDWLPGPGERAPDFLHGDPFVKISEGELRLPGVGFAARYSELEGVDPEDYAPVYQYKILSDIAPYATRTSQAESAVRASMNRGELSEREIDVFKTAREQMQEAKKSRKSFYEYEYLTSKVDMQLPGNQGATQSQEVLSVINQNLRNKQPKHALKDSIVGGYWESLIKAAHNPLEALTPLAPASKLMHLQSAIEDYERTQVFGPDIAFWNEPVDNFIMPFIREGLNFFGQTSVPEEESKEREIKAYFDLLEYTKNTRLAKQAEEEGLESVAKLYSTAAGETLVGVNPYSRNYRSIFRALPRTDRDYFNSFSSAKSVGDRERILELIPENQKRLYQSQWELQYSDQLSQQLEEGLIPDSLKASAEEELLRLYTKRDTEGFAVTPELKEQFAETRERDETYANWFRRTIILGEVAKQGGLPGADWVGWHPAVDLNDIKLKVVENAGLDMHDFDLWESDARAAAHRDFLDQAAEDIIEVETLKDGRTSNEVQIEIEKILAELGVSGQVHVYGLESNNNENTYKIKLDVTEVRDEDIRDALREMVE